MTENSPFDERSDIDLAVSGITTADFFTAYAQAMLFSPEFKLDLLDLADCLPSVRAAIVAEGSGIMITQDWTNLASFIPYRFGQGTVRESCLRA